MIKRSKNREEKPDFNDIVNDIEQEVETLQVEQDIVNRLPELKQLSFAIDKATTAVINAQLAYSGGYPFSISGDIRSVPS